MVDANLDPAAGARAAILAAEYVALTTYRRDGRAVTTPVWAAQRDGRLYILGSAEAGRIKRLRNSPKAAVAPCTMRGIITGATSQFIPTVGTYLGALPLAKILTRGADSLVSTVMERTRGGLFCGR